MKKYIVIILAALALIGCGTKKKTIAPVSEEAKEAEWHTCLIQSAGATVSRDGEKMSSTITMQTVHDSMIVVSVTPLLGIEMMRLEATPTEMIAIDKMHGQYAKATYAEINNKLTPTLNWDILQDVCTGQLPTGDERARLVYAFGEEQIELVINYTAQQWDIPLRIRHIALDRYTQIDIRKWL